VLTAVQIENRKDLFPVELFYRFKVGFKVLQAICFLTGVLKQSVEDARFFLRMLRFLLFLI